MNRSIKRVAVAALAIIMVAGYAPATFNGVKLFDTAITASAETMSETIVTGSGRTYTRTTFEGTNCSVDGFLLDSDGIAVGDLGGGSARIPITVSVGNGFKITKIEFKIIWMNNALSIDKLITSAGTLSSNNFKTNGVLTIDSIEDNVSEVKLSNSVTSAIQFKSVTVYYEEAESDPTYAPVLAQNLTYNGEAQDLVTGNGGEGGTIHYVYRKSGDTAWTAVASGYPQVKDAGTYEVGWYSDESDDYLAAGSALVPNSAGTVTIAKKAITITADDKSSQYGSDIAELTYLVTSTGFIVSDDLGVKLNTTATSASDVGEYEITVDWNGNPNFDATLENGKYTITKAPLEITASGYDGVYDGEAHSISVTYEGETDAVIYYGTEELTAENFETAGSTENPTYTNAGEYTVYFYIVSKNYEADPVSGSKVVNIAKADAAVKTAPEAVSGLIANGEYQELVTAGEAEGGKLVYAIGDENGALEPYTELLSAAVDAGTYYVWYKVIGDENHNDSEPASIEVTIADAKIDISEGTVTADPENKTVTVTVDGKTVPASEYHIIYFTYEKTADGESLTRVGTEFPTEPGTYIAAVVANEDSETYIGENRSEPFTIAAPEPAKDTEPSDTPPQTGAAAGMGALAVAAAAVIAAKKRK